MKRLLMLVVLATSHGMASDDVKTSQPSPMEVVQVATALDHLTVIEFGEPIAMAAAGSPSFQIERHEDKVFIKPLKTGASTDLFVWTASRSFTFELLPPGDVKKMNSLIDARLPSPPSNPDNQEQLNQTADMMLSRALLGAERIASSGIKNANNRVTVRIENIFQSKTTVYVHYSVVNRTIGPYRVMPPTVLVGLAPKPDVSLVSLEHSQISDDTLRRLGELRQRSVVVARSDITKQDLGSEEATEGVIAIREQLVSPAILRLIFGPAAGGSMTSATMVY